METAKEGAGAERELMTQNTERHELQILLVYFFVVGVICVAWVLGYLGFSFAWVVLLFILLYAVWRSKVIRLSGEMLQHAYLLAHRKRALRGCETTEWLNFLLNRWWGDRRQRWGRDETAFVMRNRTGLNPASGQFQFRRSTSCLLSSEALDKTSDLVLRFWGFIISEVRRLTNIKYERTIGKYLNILLVHHNKAPENEVG